MHVLSVPITKVFLGLNGADHGLGLEVDDVERTRGVVRAGEAGHQQVIAPEIGVARRTPLGQLMNRQRFARLERPFVHLSLRTGRDIQFVTLGVEGDAMRRLTHAVATVEIAPVLHRLSISVHEPVTTIAIGDPKSLVACERCIGRSPALLVSIGPSIGDLELFHRAESRIGQQDFALDVVGSDHQRKLAFARQNVRTVQIA